jgi:ribosomal protein S18 acetylase RimI-like enzyme
VTILVRSALPEERPAVAQLLAERWGSTRIVSRDRVHDAAEAATLVAARGGGDIVGVATFLVNGDEAELLTLDALEEGSGIGSALVEAVVEAAAEVLARRVVLSTTNDNLRALGFYQRRGFRLSELRPSAIDRARTQKPQIPVVGNTGIPIHDELVLVRELAGGTGGFPD